MNATVMTTGPGVIIATATASRNCRSVSQPNSFTTPPCRKGTIASPLPKTNAPASVKYQAIFQSTEPSAGPCNPVRRSGQGNTAAVTLPAGGRAAIAPRTPATRNTPTISVSVIAVTSAEAPKNTHRSFAFPIVAFASFHALRAMIPMTAAPIP